MDAIYLNERGTDAFRTADCRVALSLIFTDIRRDDAVPGCTLKQKLTPFRCVRLPGRATKVRKGNGLMSAVNYQSGDGVVLDFGLAPGGTSSTRQWTALALAAEATPAQGCVKVGYVALSVEGRKEALTLLIGL